MKAFTVEIPIWSYLKFQISTLFIRDDLGKWNSTNGFSQYSL